MESHIRSILKAITRRAGGTVVTVLTAWVFIGTLDTAVKIDVFYIHDRFWNRLNFGKVQPPEYLI
jgi:uncharacterized membrane protein